LRKTKEGGDIMKKIVILAVCLSLWLIGCSPANRISPIWQFGKNYKPNETCTTDTGSTMIKIYSAYAYPEYKPRFNYQPPDILPHVISEQNQPIVKMPEITPAQKWRATHTYGNDYIIFCDAYNPKYGIRIRQNGELASEKPWMTYSIHVWPYPVDSGFWNLSDFHVFESIEGNIIEAYKDSFKAELIYTGKMGNIITISYLEFFNNMSRPAFYQDLRYDLSESDNITFKSLKIKILEATNSKISFQVIDDGGLPWVPVRTGRSIP